MSYTMNITEKLTIHNANVKTTHIVSQIFLYLQQLDSMYRIRDFHITSAQLIADDDRVDVQDYGKEYGTGKLYRSVCGDDGEWKIIYPEDDEPTEYYGLLNSAHNLRIFTVPFREPPKEITFRIDYTCECSLAFIGSSFWRDVLESLDCAELREQVRYVCLEDSDSDAETALAWRYDESGFHPVQHQPGLDAVTDTGNWEFDMYIYGLNEERQEGTPAQKEADRQVVDALNAYSKKYDLSFEPEDLTEITVDGYYACAADEIPQLLEDIQQMMRFLDEKGYGPTLSTLHSVYREFGKLAAIRYDFDWSSRVLRVESVRL